MIQTFGDTWTSQLFVLADYFNVQAAVPDFADDYTANKAKYATTPAALKGFEHQEEVFKAGYLNEDFAAAKFDDGLRMVATGEGAHYPMLTFAIGGIAQDYPENLKDVGFFAMPGDDAAKNGLTVWMPAAVYIAKTTKHPEEAKKFLAFIASTKGCDVRSAANGATGPYLIKGCTLPADVPPAVADLLPYFQKDGATAPGARVPVADQGPGARADHRRSRLRHPLGRRRRRALRRGREEAGPAARPSRLVSYRRGRYTPRPVRAAGAGPIR